MAKTSKPLKWALITYSLLAFFIGVGYIAWGVVLQNPPSQALPLGLVIVGCASIVLSACGCLNSLCGRCCLSVFFFLATLVALGELAIVISLFVNLDGNVEQLTDYKGKAEAAAADGKGGDELDAVSEQQAAAANAAQQAQQQALEAQQAAVNVGRRLVQAGQKALENEENIRNALEIGRYIFLVAVLLEFIALMASIVLRVRSPHASDDDEDVEERQAARSAMAQIQMEGLKHSMSKAASRSPAVGATDGNFYTSSTKMAKSVSRRMSQKYGEFTADPAYQKKWYQKGGGFFG
jgi:hypothetical protein